MKIITCVVNNPIFIEIQYHTLKKYMRNEYEYIVFNDAKDYIDDTNGGNIKIKEEINNTCKRLGIKCIEIPNNYNFNKNLKCPSTRTALGMNFMLKYQLANPDKYLILESDMFLIDYLDVNERYNNYKTAFNLHSRIEEEKIINYAWVGIVYLDMTKIDDGYYLDWGLNYGITDTGGLSELWINKQLKENEKYPTMYEIIFNRYDNYNTDNVYLIKNRRGHTWRIEEIPENLKNREKLKEFMRNDKRNIGELIFSEIYDDIFYHYVAGCNWRKEGFEYHIEQSKKLKEILVDVDEN